MDSLFKDEILKYSTIIYDDKCEVQFIKDIETDSFDIEGGDNLISGVKRMLTHHDETSFNQNKKNLLASVTFSKALLVVERTDEKISFKIFNSRYHRSMGTKWFRVVKSMDFITYRFKDGAVFFGRMNNYHKKRNFTKQLRRYAFGYRDIINEAQQVCRDFYSLKENDTPVYDMSSPIKIFVNNIPGVENYGHLTTKEKFYSVFLEKNGIKYPNNFMSFVYGNQSLTKKILLKNDYKMIDTLMSINRLNGGKIRKILHKINGVFHGDNYRNLVDFYGESFILAQNDDILMKIFTFEKCILLPTMSHHLSKKELKNSFKIIKCVLDEAMNPGTFLDHLRFYNYLRNREKIKWVSDNIESFIVEHQLWSDKYSDYSSGNFERIYSQQFINYIETTIVKGGNTFYPVVLINSDTYNEESKVQCNCVRTYIKNVNSVIVSLREGDKHHSSTRATIEYFVSVTDNGDLTLERGQTRGKYNGNLDIEIWGESLKELDIRVSNALELKLFNEHKIRVLFKNGDKQEVNHVIFTHETGYKPIHQLCWDNPDLIYHTEYTTNEIYGNTINLNF
jgi:hypothetical protein